MPRVETDLRFQQGLCFEIHRNTQKKEEDQQMNLNTSEIIDMRFKQQKSNINMTAVMKKGTQKNIRGKKNSPKDLIEKKLR